MKYALFLLFISLQANAAVRSVSNFETFNVLVAIFTLIWLLGLFVNRNKENWANTPFAYLIAVYGLFLGIPSAVITIFDSKWGFITTAICIGLALYDNLKAK